MHRYIRNTCLLFVAVLIMTAAACSSTSHPDVQTVAGPPGIVARINGRELNSRQLQRMVTRIENLNRERGISALPDEVRKRALDQLVLEELAVQEAGRQKIRITAGDIETAITMAAGHDPKDYAALLEKQGMTDSEFREEIRRGMLVRTIFSREVTEKMSVSDEDVRTEYERRKERLTVPEIVTVADAAFPVQPDEQAAIKKADELRNRFASTKDKDLLTLTPEPDGYTIAKLDLNKSKEPDLYEAARKLGEREVSHAVKAGNKIHVVQLLSVTAERPMTFDEAKPNLLKELQGRAFAKRRLAWEQELRKDAKIELVNP